jgi:hypothetical protein
MVSPIISPPGSLVPGAFSEQTLSSALRKTTLSLLARFQAVKGDLGGSARHWLQGYCRVNDTFSTRHVHC